MATASHLLAANLARKDMDIEGEDGELCLEIDAGARVRQGCFLLEGGG